MGWRRGQSRVHVVNSVLISIAENALSEKAPFSSIVVFVDQRQQSRKRIRKWGVEMKSATKVISWHHS